MDRMKNRVGYGGVNVNAFTEFIIDSVIQIG